MEKVYCTQCLFFSGTGNNYRCKYPDNFKWIVTWLGKKKEDKKAPSEINRNCDCSWFELKPATPAQETAEKVYCSKCKWLGLEGTVLRICKKPRENYFSQDDPCCARPCNKNMNNFCKDFESKE